MGAVVVFAAAAWVILYVVVLYPLALGWYARHRAHPVQRTPIHPSVSIIVAVYNGESFLLDKLKSILSLDYPRERTEVIVASDGSVDRTAAIANYKRYLDIGGALETAARNGLTRLEWAPSAK